MNQNSFFKLMAWCGGGVFVAALIFSEVGGNNLEKFDVGIRMTLRFVGATIAFAGLFLTIRNSLSGPGPSVLGRSACIFLAGCTILYSSWGYALSLAILLAALIVVPAISGSKAGATDAASES